jgi:hypothetical protein
LKNTKIKDEGRRKREEGRRKKEEGRKKIFPILAISPSPNSRPLPILALSASPQRSNFCVVRTTFSCCSMLYSLKYAKSIFEKSIFQLK